MQGRDATGMSSNKVALGWQTSGGNIEFHPSNGTLYMASGQGLFKSTPPTHWATSDPTSVWWWEEDTLGVEQLVVTGVYTPSGGKPIYSCGDFGNFEVMDDTYAGTKSEIPQPVGGSGDETAWSVESAPNNPGFMTTCCGYWHNTHAYRNGFNDSWHVFTGSFPDASILYNGGVILPQSTTDFYSNTCCTIGYW
jgi:hypothetical protein